MEALQFIDDDVLLFLALGITLLVGYSVWMFVREYLKVKAEEPMPVEVPVVVEEPPVLTEPVGMSVQTFNQLDQQEVQEVQELVAAQYPLPLEGAQYPTPAVVVNTSPTRTIEGPFIDRYDLIGFLQTNDIQAAVHLDDAVVQGGFGPALQYRTDSVGVIRRMGS
jgi:hypothetical protein